MYPACLIGMRAVASMGTASIIADALGLKLELVPVAWPDWPLGLESGKFDAVISNVTVTEARKERESVGRLLNDVSPSGRCLT